MPKYKALCGVNWTIRNGTTIWNWNRSTNYSPLTRKTELLYVITCIDLVRFSIFFFFLLCSFTERWLNRRSEIDGKESNENSFSYRWTSGTELYNFIEQIEDERRRNIQVRFCKKRRPFPKTFFRNSMIQFQSHSIDGFKRATSY